MDDVKTLAGWIETGGKAVITTHQNPDADALGSSLALARYLKIKGLDVQVISPTEYPAFLFWMAGNSEVIVHNANKPEDSEKFIVDANLIFCLDFSSLDRIGELGEMVRKASARKILVDHHIAPENFHDFKRWSTEAAATAELIYELIVDLGDKSLIDNQIADCLYAGIMTDTGNFKHSNVTKNVFRVCGELIDLGADISRVTQDIYDNNSPDRLRLLGYSLHEKLVLIREYGTAYISLSREELRRFNARPGDTEGVVNYALSLKGVVFAALFTEKDDRIKISFRSSGDFSVNDFAREYFNGGGHKNAAGGKSDLGLEETLEKFESILKNHSDELSNS